MKILAIIPARMGSQRLPRKNVLDIEPGLTLVQHAVDCAYHSGVIDRVVVASDDHSIHLRNAERVILPSELAGPTADIAGAVAHAARIVGGGSIDHDYVVTLQPAVLARSAVIVRRLVEMVVQTSARGGITAARTVPWQWTVENGAAQNSWSPGAYPRSQGAPVHLAEINAVQVAHRDVVAAGKRWGTPLVFAELPPWAAALDIDDPEDLARARDLWPWARWRLETWDPPMHYVNDANGVAV